MFERFSLLLLCLLALTLFFPAPAAASNCSSCGYGVQQVQFFQAPYVQLVQPFVSAIQVQLPYPAAVAIRQRVVVQRQVAVQQTVVQRQVIRQRVIQRVGY